MIRVAPSSAARRVVNADAFMSPRTSVERISRSGMISTSRTLSNVSAIKPNRKRLVCATRSLPCELLMIRLMVTLETKRAMSS